MPDTSKPDINLFYCYAREDKALRDELEISLSGLKRQYRLTNWSDREILPGEQWEPAIDTHLDTADVILLLISPHFLASDYCYGKEMQRALERHQAGICRVIPILLRPTYWEESPFSDIQMLPTDAKPITSWPDRYEAFHDVAKGIDTAIKTLRTSPEHKAEEDWIKEARAFIDQKDYEKALAAYERAIRLDPDNIGIYHEKGLVLLVLNRPDEALEAFEQAIRLDPKASGPYNGKGAALYELNRPDEALAAFEQAIQRNPGDAVAYYNKGRVFYNLKRYEEAIDAFLWAIHYNPYYAKAYYDKGLSLKALGRKIEAQESFEKARFFVDFFKD